MGLWALWAGRVPRPPCTLSSGWAGGRCAGRRGVRIGGLHLFGGAAGRPRTHRRLCSRAGRVRGKSEHDRARWWATPTRGHADASRRRGRPRGVDRGTVRPAAGVKKPDRRWPSPRATATADQARVRRCGKSAPADWRQPATKTPHRVQAQAGIGPDRRAPSARRSIPGRVQGKAAHDRRPHRVGNGAGREMAARIGRPANGPAGTSPRHKAPGRNSSREPPTRQNSAYTLRSASF